MIRIAYLECPTGIAGDMCLGALVDLGVPLAYLTDQLERLGIAREYWLRVEQVHRNGQRATKFHVELLDDSGAAVNPDISTTFDHAVHHHPIRSGIEASVSVRKGDEHAGAIHDHHHHTRPDAHSDSQTPGSEGMGELESNNLNPSDTLHDRPRPPVPIRHLPEIERLILSTKLPARAEAWSLAIFRKLAEAEGAVHGIPPEQVHFHEVGATDAIVDIVGTCLGLDWLGIDQLYCSALPIGGGTFRAAHGRLPAPAPAVLKLFEMRRVPIYSNGIERELVTPTGAAIPRL